jgi:hypothetical protein
LIFEIGFTLFLIGGIRSKSGPFFHGAKRSRKAKNMGWESSRNSPGRPAISVRHIYAYKEGLFVRAYDEAE